MSVDSRLQYLWKPQLDDTEPPLQQEDGAVDQQQEPQGGGNSGQDISAATIGVPIRSQGPQSPRQKKKTADQRRDCRDRWRLGAEIATAIIGAIGLGALVVTLDQSRRATEAATEQARVAVEALHNQRPQIALGRGDGVIAEYQPPAKGEEKGTIALYFLNAGSAPALRFIVNVSSSLPSALIPRNHLYRRKMVYNGKLVGSIYMGGSTVGVNSSRVQMLHATSVPSPEEWKRIESGKLNFIIRGTVEYCDSWGKYTCEIVNISRQPSDGRKFTISTSSTCVSSVLSFSYSPGVNSYPPSSYPVELEIAPRCEQPAERAQEEQELEETVTGEMVMPTEGK